MKNIIFVAAPAAGKGTISAKVYDMISELLLK